MNKWLLLLCAPLLLADSGLARDSSRYPYKNFAFVGENIGVFSAVYREIWPVMVSVNVDPTFSFEQKMLLYRSAQIFTQRVMSADVIDCAYDRATRDLPISRDDFEKRMYTAFGLKEGRGGLPFPAPIHIARFWQDEKAVGIAYSDLFYKRDHPLPGYQDNHYIHIALNSDFMGDDSPDYGHAKDPEYWAGVIAHEALHNLGYEHPDGYEGSFINEFGNCVWHGRRWSFKSDMPVFAERRASEEKATQGREGRWGQKHPRP